MQYVVHTIDDLYELLSKSNKPVRERTIQSAYKKFSQWGSCASSVHLQENHVAFLHINVALNFKLSILRKKERSQRKTKGKIWLIFLKIII